jgi:MoaA/NifB/PqqE/SkfB family radical SAM enzyme
VGNWSGRKIKDYSTREIITIIDECIALGTVHFTIHGGEILVRNDVREIIDYLKKKGSFVNLVTNGILLREKIDDLMGVDSLCISLDGREENNDFNRGKGSYQAAMEAISIAKERRLKFVVHATLTRKSIHDIEYLCEQAKRLGYYQQFSLLLKPLTPGQSDLGISDTDARDAIRRIMKLKRKGYPVFTSKRTLRNALNWPFPLSEARIDKSKYLLNKKLIRCFYGKLKIAIDANGHVYPCSSLNDSFNALNVRDVGVKKAFEHVIRQNTCEACYYLTQNDWSLLLGGSPEQYLSQAIIQLKSIFDKRKGFCS